MKQVILLRIHERRSFAQIGLTMHRSAEAARKLWGRAIRRLEQKLRQGGDGE
jgi:DNA-directed RNA polymerase specialized sigma24 family protein